MSLTLSRILHAGYIFGSGDTQIVFDPIFENPFGHNCYAYPSVNFNQDAIRDLKFSAVFISHYHDDHCSLESLDLIDRATPIYLYCQHEEMLGLIRELGFSSVKKLTLDTPVTVGPITVTPLRALDSDVDAVFAIESGKVRILNVVDSWIDPVILPALSKKAPWTLVLWPFQTMRELEVLSPSRASAADGQIPHEWIMQLISLLPEFVVPSSCQFVHESWSWLNHSMFPISYRGFGRQVERALPATKVIRLDSGMTAKVDVQAMTFLKPLSWIDRVGPQSVDYDYQPLREIPTTREIARQFPPLTSEQRAIIDAFVKRDLIDSLRPMAHETEFFKRPRRWRLEIYDHNDGPQVFHYEISDTDGAKALGQATEAEWVTEVPAARLAGALENGETMSSMYLRINDRKLSPATEEELKNFDPLEDPLVRALFTGVFGAYQRAQLARIRQRENSPTP